MAIYSTCSSSESFYTPKQSTRSSARAMHKTPFIRLNGSQYQLTVYHKKSNQSEWKEITNHCLDLVKDSNFRKMIQQIKQPCSEIEIQATLHQNAASKNSIYCLVTENGSKRKVNLSVNTSLFAKVSQLFVHNIKNLASHTNGSIETDIKTGLVNQWIQDSVFCSPKKYDALFAKELLQETKKDPQMRTWLEDRPFYGQYWKTLHEKHQQPDAELTAEDLQNFSDCLIDFSDFQFLEKEELLQNIQEAMSDVKTEIKIVAKPTQVFGFKNKSMNCGFNACLQMILNEPALLNIYATVANYYAEGKYAEDKAKHQQCGKWMLSLLEQNSGKSDISQNFRLAMHFLSNGIISKEFSKQEDANEILTILFSKYEDILKKERTIELLLRYLADFKKNKVPAKIPPDLEPILGEKKITQGLLENMIKKCRQEGLNTLLTTSLMHYTVKHTTHHKIEKIDSANVDKEKYSILPEDNTLVKETPEWNLKIKFPKNSEAFALDTLLRNYFCNENVADSHSRKFIKNTDLVEASIIKEELEFNKLPEHLFINLERFAPNTENTSIKLNNPITIPETLDARSLRVSGHPNASYELRSFIVHLGTTLGSGHYIAYRKVENQWWKCNDLQVFPVSQQDMLNALSDSYSCFYTRKS